MQPASDILSFAARVIEVQGGLAERVNDRLQAILPSALGAALGLPEEVWLNSPETPLLLGSPLLDRLIGTATREIPVVMGRLEIPYLKKAGFENLLGKELTFYDCRSEFTGRAEVRTQYLVLWAHYVALSDERKEGLACAGVQEHSGAVVEDLGTQWRKFSVRSYGQDKVPPVFSTPPAERAVAAAIAGARDIARAELGGFVASMERRLRRDIANLREYYQALTDEMEASLERHNLGEAQRQERLAKIAELPRECARKVEDARQKYRVDVRLAACAGLRLNCDAVQVMVTVRHRALSRLAHLIWNPMTQHLDPLSCERCGATIRSVYTLIEGQSLRFVCLRCQRGYPNIRAMGGHL